MKRLYVAFLGLALGCALGFVAMAIASAAQDRAIPSPDRLASLTAAPVIDLNGTVVSFLVTAKFITLDAHPNGTMDSREIGSVQFDLAKNGGSVVVGTEVYDDREIKDALMAVALREWKKANPDPLPQRRRAMRTPQP